MRAVVRTSRASLVFCLKPAHRPVADDMEKLPFRPVIDRGFRSRPYFTFQQIVLYLPAARTLISSNPYFILQPPIFYLPAVHTLSSMSLHFILQQPILYLLAAKMLSLTADTHQSACTLVHKQPYTLSLIIFFHILSSSRPYYILQQPIYNLAASITLSLNSLHIIL